MILTELPDLSPHPLSAADARFRHAFYRRWGRENCVVSGVARHAEYGQFRQMLSVKCVARGTEEYFVERRRITVSDETYLVLNEGRTYGSLLSAPQPSYSFAIFFRPGLAAEIAGGLARTADQSLDDGAVERAAPLEFAETLRCHDSLVSPVLRFMQREIAAGVRDENWLEEQCQFLVARLIRARRAHTAANGDPSAPRGTRREILRRLQLAIDFMHANLAHDITLESIAAAANLSRFHFLRLFTRAHGCTPFAYLRGLRTRRALALLESTTGCAHGIARQVGMTRHALWRSLCELTGAGARLRRRDADGRARAAFLAASDGLSS